MMLAAPAAPGPLPWSPKRCGHCRRRGRGCIPARSLREPSGSTRARGGWAGPRLLLSRTDGGPRGAESRALSGGREGAFVPGASSCPGAAWRPARRRGPSLWVSSLPRPEWIRRCPPGLGGEGPEPKCPDTTRGWVPGFFPLQQPRVPGQRRAEALPRSQGRIRGALGPAAGSGSPGERGRVCSAPRSVAGIGCVCVLLILLLLLLLLLLFFFCKK